jgi:hypothetical protein
MKSPASGIVADMDRSHASTRKVTLATLDDAFDRAFWAGLSPSEKLAEAWRLSEELWRFTGRDPGEPGLSRSVARLLRR